MNMIHLYDKDALALDWMEIHPGDHVVLKPNLVKEGREDKPDEWECVITSPWLIRRVCEYVCEKLQGKGLVTICDAPQSDSDFAKIRVRARLDETVAECSAKYGIIRKAFTPLAYFLYSYVIKGGFLDGWAGFYFAALKFCQLVHIQAKIYERTFENKRKDASL